MAQAKGVEGEVESRFGQWSRVVGPRETESPLIK